MQEKATYCRRCFGPRVVRPASTEWYMVWRKAVRSFQLSVAKQIHVYSGVMVLYHVWISWRISWSSSGRSWPGGWVFICQGRTYMNWRPFISDTFGHQFGVKFGVLSDTFGHFRTPIRSTFRSTFGQFRTILGHFGENQKRKRAQKIRKPCAKIRKRAQFFFWLFRIRNSFGVVRSCFGVFFSGCFGVACSRLLVRCHARTEHWRLNHLLKWLWYN